MTSYLSQRTLRIGLIFLLLPLIAGMLVSPKPVAATSVALTGAVAVAGVLWRKGIFRSNID